jgi:SAM-dependent methyltransferase
MKFFRSSSPEARTRKPTATPQKVTRRSSGLAEVGRLLKSGEPLSILDIGATSAANIRYFTELGHRIYSEDLLGASTDPSLVIKDQEGKPALDSRRFLDDNLVFPQAQFDIVLCWNLADYMDESLVKPVVGRLWSMLKPGGALLAFFHTQDAGPDAICSRFNVLTPDTLEIQPIETRRDNDSHKGAPAPRGFRLQRVFNNRHIENLFRDFASIKFFLSRDNIREVLVIR